MMPGSFIGVEIQDGHFIKEEKKKWGWERVLVNNEEYCAKYLDISPGGVSSLHYHMIKDETFCILAGTCNIEILVGQMREGDLEGKGMEWAKKIFTEGTRIRFRPRQTHRFSCDLDQRCRILEVSKHHSDEDVFRLQPSYNMCEKGPS